MKKLLQTLVVGSIISSMTITSFGATYDFSKNVYKKGQKSHEIRVIQEALKNGGTFSAKATGYYGSVTYNSVKSFQKKYKLKADGLVGKQTIAKLNSLSLFNVKSTNKNISQQSTSRGTSSRAYGQKLNWWTQIKGSILNPGDTFTVKDFHTGKTFNLKYTVGSNHSDVEPLTVADTNIIKSIWGGFNWSRRPVLVYKNGKTIAGSMIGMPHAGKDNQPSGKFIANRSGGFGYGANLDYVKNNGMDGVLCLHFYNSKTHGSKKIDQKHQAAINKAAGR
ncbi:MAG: peptidoglycan-binding protein [Anaeromicrobium sp.]|uniref:peptidoglycan-binding domain-containing protein n=1 Tax=Anaeromicrobium sp. TaxID=1929132 RepID=UPI0025F8F780|nr:peptidoglycan-binding domain-containing protein [Anaeromicrobium sp.]MCT4595285.1 peptidoglycan-binding protein [Anaeromicrobium sp.]